MREIADSAGVVIETLIFAGEAPPAVEADEEGETNRENFFSPRRKLFRNIRETVA